MSLVIIERAAAWQICLIIKKRKAKNQLGNDGYQTYQIGAGAASRNYDLVGVDSKSVRILFALNVFC